MNVEQDLFNFYDVDGNGFITRDELQQVLSDCAKDIGLNVAPYLDQIVENIFNEARLDQQGTITFEALKEVLRKRPNLINELSINERKARGEEEELYTGVLDQGVADGTSEMIKRRANEKQLLILDKIAKKFPLINKLRYEYITNNLARFNFFVCIFTISLALFVARIGTYWNHCGFLILARASGQCLNFFCAAIALLVCRRSISTLRSNGYGRILPLDDHVYFHKMFGLFILGHSMSHGFGHVFNFLLISQQQGTENADSGPKYSWGELLFGTQAGIGWIGGCASLTGWFLLLIILIMGLAYPFSRSLGRFELFYYTHLLYIPFWGLLAIHARHFWLWFLVPFTIFLIEAIIRLKRLLTNLTSTGKTQIVKAEPLPSNVIHLVIKRPPSFEFNPGDWVYVLIPQIAKYEWHPFTISSAPEEEGVISLHIRAVGEWTRSLKCFFDNLTHRNHLERFIKSGQFSISMDQFGGQAHRHSIAQITRDMPNITIFLDGPYGSPSSQIFGSEHAVLIATGIGVTPFASILQSIVHHYEKRRQKCPTCACEFLDNRPPIVCKLKKVDFVWINRDQKSFEWFIKLLACLELTQSSLTPQERFLDIHIHLTAMEPAQIKTMGLQLALYLIHEKDNKDLVTGLKTRTKAGRPNWDEFFAKIEEQKRGKVSVFFCGRPQLGRYLHRQCDKLGFKFRKEIF